MSQEAISASTPVLVLNAQGTRIGQMRFDEARKLANLENLDLVTIDRQDNIVVCKIIDHNKWKYEQKKKQKHMHHVASVVKEMKFSLRIEPHDQEVKMNHIKKFLEKGFDVKMVVEMHGREKANPQMAIQKMHDLLGCLNGDTRVDPVKQSGYSITALVHPKRDKHA